MRVRRGGYRSPDQRIVDGIREFYLGMLSKYLPHEAFDSARSDHATEVAMECLRQIRREIAARGRFPEPKACPGHGYTNEGDPEIGNALFDCEACGGGRLPAGDVPSVPAVAVAPAVPPAHGELPRHQFWGAGEPDCPPELKAPNGELHTMRCKVCGDGWRKSHNVCLAARQGMPIERVAMLWNSLPLETDPQSVLAFARAIERFHGIGTGESLKEGVEALNPGQTASGVLASDKSQQENPQ